MKKTVEEIMKAAPETIFYIGSASGYFFIGNYEAWKRDGRAINEKCLINPINIATYLFIRNDDGTSKIERKFVSVDNQISFDSFYNTVMNDIELTSDINQFY